MPGLTNWRNVYLLTIPLRVVFALSNSYIHPDEHFQTIEVLSRRILGYSTNIPWEFDAAAKPARSLVPLYFVYGPLLYVVKWCKVQLDPVQIWYLLRLQLCLLSWLVTDLCLYKMSPSKNERIKSIFFTSTSFVTFVFQSHLFSNSVETLVLLLAVCTIDDLKLAMESETTEAEENDEKKTTKKTTKSKTLVWLGALVAFGIFNRVTFPAFLILPSWYLLQYMLTRPMSICYISLGLLLTSTAIIFADTALFQSDHYVVAPLNNLIYNSRLENLSQHGLHSRYTHLVINLPQLMGPGILFVVSRKKYYIKSTAFLAALSGMIFLSFVPHQELRFLVPVVPLLCCSFDLDKKWIGPWTIYLWYAFNGAMSVLMGVYHQGGVVPALSYFKEKNLHGVQVWWHTYSPPSWILGSESVETLSLTDDVNHGKHFTIIDAMGSDLDKVVQKLDEVWSKESKPVYLVTPLASFTHLDASRFNPVWNYTHHIDLDHIDWSNFQTGLGIYELI
ncbi:uncharacterized protein LODBEIA_P46300 [Lodderomyces beijingensis]|uniref:Mannosyltransferase n=1 Tax=Lodderomyces beijingensis TaxID=1775926 RepID=A0ABP0ZQH2_9ASCO